MYEPAPESEALPPLDVPGANGPPPQPSRMAARITALLEVILCSGYPTQLLIVLVMTSLGLQIRTPSDGLTPSFVFTLSLIDAVLVVTLVVLFIRRDGERVAAVLIGNRAPAREAVLGILLVPAVFLVVTIVLAIVLTLAPRLHNIATNPLEAMVQTPRDAIIFSIVVMIAGGVREEVQRGFIIHRFDQHLGGAAVGVAVYSIAFGLGHLEQGRDAALATAVLGAVWGTIYVVRRSIVAPMVSHAGFNLLQLIKFVSLR